MRELLTEFNLCPKKLPSYHLLTSRNQPKIVPFILPNSNELHNNSHEITENIDIEDTSEPDDEPGLQPTEVFSVSSFVSNKPEILSEAVQAIWKSKRVENEVIGARIAGGFKEHVVRMANKHIRKGRTLSGDILVINSYDGAEHTNTKKGKTGIVSFSSQMCSTSTIKDGASTAKSMNILTWQQMVGDENRKNIFPAIKETLKEIKQLKENGIPEIPNTNITYFELHNGKMLYLLTQHSLFNRKHFPFLLCKCQRGQGVTDENHECQYVGHNEQCKYWDRSLRRWNNKMTEVGPNKYKYTHHMKWIDEKNYGMSHFGFHPTLLNRDSLRFDVLHLRCSITRQLMNHLRSFMIMQSTEILFEFSNLMLTFWNDYNVLVWNLNKKFTSFVGAELLLFITNTEKIITFIECKFCKTNTRDDLCNGLRLWYQITPFLVITTIKDVEKYETTRKQFLLDLKQFYTIGGRSFLTKKAITGHVGNDETFYMHVLRFYIPRIADDTFEK